MPLNEGRVLVEPAVSDQDTLRSWKSFCLPVCCCNLSSRRHVQQSSGRKSARPRCGQRCEYHEPGSTPRRETRGCNSGNWLAAYPWILVQAKLVPQIIFSKLRQNWLDDFACRNLLELAPSGIPETQNARVELGFSTASLFTSIWPLLFCLQIQMRHRHCCAVISLS